MRSAIVWCCLLCLHLLAFVFFCLFSFTFIHFLQLHPLYTLSSTLYTFIVSLRLFCCLFCLCLCISLCLVFVITAWQKTSSSFLAIYHIRVWHDPGMILSGCSSALDFWRGYGRTKLQQVPVDLKITNVNCKKWKS